MKKQSNITKANIHQEHKYTITQNKHKQVAQLSQRDRATP